MKVAVKAKDGRWMALSKTTDPSKEPPKIKYQWKTQN